MVPVLDPAGIGRGGGRMAMPGTSTPTGWCSISRARYRAKGRTVKTGDRGQPGIRNARRDRGQAREVDGGRRGRIAARRAQWLRETRRGAGRTGVGRLKAGICAHPESRPLRRVGVAAQSAAVGGMDVSGMADAAWGPVTTWYAKADAGQGSIVSPAPLRKTRWPSPMTPGPEGHGAGGGESRVYP